MNDHFFSQQHGRLFDSQCGGLGTAWQRAALNLQEDNPVEAPHDGAVAVLRWMLPAVGVVAVAGYLLSLWLDDRVEEPPAAAAIVGVPLAPSLQSSAPV